MAISVPSTPPHRRFITFAMDRYYPGGGLDDIQGSADTVEEARAIGRDSRCEDWYVVDRDTWERVAIPRPPGKTA